MSSRVAKGCAMHKWVIIVLLGTGAVALAKRTEFGSYAGTLWSKVRTETKLKIPTRFEIERARHELAGLDRDIAAMIRPLAEHKAALAQMDKDLEQTQANLEGRRQSSCCGSRRTSRKTRRRLPSDNGTSVARRLGRCSTATSRASAAWNGTWKASASCATRGKRLSRPPRSSSPGSRPRSASSRCDWLSSRPTRKCCGSPALAIRSPWTTIGPRRSRRRLRDIEKRQHVRRAELELSQGDLIGELTREPAAAPKSDLAGIRAHLERPAAGGQ